MMIVCDECGTAVGQNDAVFTETGGALCEAHRPVDFRAWCHENGYADVLAIGQRISVARLEEAVAAFQATTAEPGSEWVTLKAKVYEWECPVCEAWNDEEDNGRDEVTCTECGRTFAVGTAVHKGE